MNNFNVSEWDPFTWEGGCSGSHEWSQVTSTNLKGVSRARWQAALSVPDKLKHSTEFRVHLVNLVRRWGQKHNWKHDWKLFIQRQNLRKHTSSTVLTRRGRLAWNVVLDRQQESKGHYSGQLIWHGALWVLTLD